MRIALQLEIASPPERVFAAYVDPALVPRWRPAVRSIGELSGPMDRVGTTFVTRYRGPAPAGSGRVVEVREDERHVLEGHGAVAYRAELRLAEEGEGSRVSFVLDARMRGGVAGRAVERLGLERRVARETTADFERLKALVEGAA